ncbi:CU044_5270 family protein [Crossiella sp. SN42]|uniref:CU044_5270 family protein n=1 Tax=Crossiella sp. SN42 TaxID=2944808 RepID=UPI00207C7223|nr:CU044_5270 family protein [Crossiella sp. SN42]MCO1576445.1 CU044_5270 family protein [Crossiella sp. SN42]
MTRTRDELRQLIAGLDPAVGHQPAPGPAERAADLHRILGSGPPVRTPGIRPRRVLLLAAAAAVTVVVGAVLLPGTGPRAHAVTPAPLVVEPPADPGRSAADLLRDLAAVTEGLPEPSTDGLAEHLRMESWYLNSQVDRTGTVSAVIPGELDRWRFPDGSGYERKLVKEPVFSSAEDRQRWLSEGSPGWDMTPKTQRFGPGERDEGFDGPPPADAARFADWLRRGFDFAKEPFRAFAAATDAARTHVLLPRQRAWLLRALADTSGFTYDGMTTDRAGRRGHSVTLTDTSGLPARRTLVIDPADGRVLDREEMLVSDPGELNVRVPAVISYEVYLIAEHAAGPR